MATLNTANPDEDFALTAGGGRLGVTGTFAGCLLRLSYALSATPSVFSPFPEGEFLAPFAMTVNLAAGDVVRAVISKPGGVPAETSINIQYDEPA